MKDSVDRIAASVRASQTLRLLSIGFLALLLQIPVSMIDGLVRERQQRRQAAVEDVSSKWGRAQAITGPALVVPYTHRWTEETDGRTVTRTDVRQAVFLPEQLRLRGTLATEIRRRGIFSVPVYTLALNTEGEFAPPDFAALGIDRADVDWAKAHVAVGITDARAIKQGTTLTFGGRQTEFLPGTGGFADVGAGVHAPVAMTGDTSRVRFSFPLSLNGSMQVEVVPFGRTTEVDLQGDWGHPSFQGSWLPTQRTVEPGAFKAHWSVSFLGRSYPQAWTSDKASGGLLGESRFGVQLNDPVDHYRMAARSVKYAGLFILLTFATLWLIEVLSGIRVHPIQYLMLGGALCLFYLLELSLSEHIGFPAAYALASLLVVAMVGAYSRAVLRHPRHALVVAAGVALLYAYLYLLLMNEDYALLIGAIGLFTILGAIMYVTRRVDWYAVGTRTPEPTVE